MKRYKLLKPLPGFTESTIVWKNGGDFYGGTQLNRTELKDWQQGMLYKAMSGGYMEEIKNDDIIFDSISMEAIDKNTGKRYLVSFTEISD